MNCKYLKIRTKKYKKYKYCSFLKKQINSECLNCLNKTYKTIKKINSISKKREFVSKETYNVVFERCKGKCVICGTYKELQLHHIDGRGKGKTDNPKNCVMLCRECHLNKVHKNNKYWRKELKTMI